MTLATTGPAAAFSAEKPDRYTFYLVIMALAGWALASYDVNLLVLALPDVAKGLNISQSGIGVLGFFVYAAQFVITLFAGWGMDTFGRRKVWMVCLAGTAIFTGLTYFVQNFWELVAVRALASGLAYSELAVSITIVNEQVPAKQRGLLYSIVQGGWPLGVFLASGVYLMTGQYGWRVVFLLGVIPLVAVILGRLFIRESERFEHMADIRTAHQSGDEARVEALRAQRAIAVEEMDRVTVGQLFSAASGVRRQLILLSLIAIIYGTSYVATNFYITYWLTSFKGFSSVGASTLLLASGGIGFFFYVIGGLLGERFGRRSVMIVTGALVAPLSLIFLYAQDKWVVVLVYFLLYQVTNGTWSGAGYAYQGESFPTRVRGSAIGFLSAMQVLGFVFGTLLWTLCTNTISNNGTWIVLGVLVPLGLWLTVFLRPIAPKQELEAIAQ